MKPRASAGRLLTGDDRPSGPGCVANTDGRSVTAPGEFARWLVTRRAAHRWRVTMRVRDAATRRTSPAGLGPFTLYYVPSRSGLNLAVRTSTKRRGISCDPSATDWDGAGSNASECRTQFLDPAAAARWPRAERCPGAACSRQDVFRLGQRATALRANGVSQSRASAGAIPTGGRTSDWASPPPPRARPRIAIRFG